MSLGDTGNGYAYELGRSSREIQMLENQNKVLKKALKLAVARLNNMVLANSEQANPALFSVKFFTDGAKK